MRSHGTNLSGTWICSRRIENCIALRHAHSALRAPGYQHVATDGHLYVFERFDDNEHLRVAVNAGDSTASAPIDGNLDLLWGNATTTTAGEVSLPARSGAVWRIG